MKILILLIILACSCTPQDKVIEGAHNTGAHSLQLSALDSEEDGKGSELTEVSGFAGDLFKEYAITLQFYNQQTKQYDSLNWITKEGVLRFCWETVNRKSPPGGVYMGSLLKRFATNSNFTKNNFRISDFNDGMFSFSAPILMEDSLLVISEKILDLQRRGFSISRVEVSLFGKFNLSSAKFKTFKNPVFDFYYKPKNKNEPIFIESQTVVGNYHFNQENEAFLDFVNFDGALINEAIVSGGSNFLLKLRDFTIGETEESYLSVLEKIQSKSIPLTLVIPNYAERKMAKVERIYVQTNGEEKSLKDILSLAFGNDMVMTDTGIERIKELSNLQRGSNENLKWIIGTSKKTDNIYDSTLSPTDGIALAYLSDKESEKAPNFVSRSTLSNNNTVNSGKLPSETNDFKIKIYPKKILTPTQSFRQFSRPDCGRGNWDTNSVLYRQVELQWVNTTASFQSQILGDAYIRINSPKGSLLEGNIGQLLSKNLLKVDPIKSDNSVEITITDKVKKAIFEEETTIQIEIGLRPTSVAIDVGRTERVRANCERRTHPDPPHGVDGGPRGMLSGLDSLDRAQYETGFGFSTQQFERSYDLNVHVLSY